MRTEGGVARIPKLAWHKAWKVALGLGLMALPKPAPAGEAVVVDPYKTVAVDEEPTTIFPQPDHSAAWPLGPTHAPPQAHPQTRVSPPVRIGDASDGLAPGIAGDDATLSLPYLMLGPDLETPMSALREVSRLGTLDWPRANRVTCEAAMVELERMSRALEVIAMEMHVEHARNWAVDTRIAERLGSIDAGGKAQAESVSAEVKPALDGTFASFKGRPPTWSRSRAR